MAHNKIITLMCFAKRCSHMWPLYCQLKVLPLDILINIEYGKCMFKFNNGLLPEVFKNYFRKPSHHYSTRYATSNKNLEVQRVTTNKEKSLLKYIGPKIWSNIPLNIKDSLSLKVFIKSYHNFLIGFC